MGDAGGVEGAEFVAEVAVAGDILVVEAEDSDGAGSRSLGTSIYSGNSNISVSSGAGLPRLLPFFNTHRR